jgi:D-aminoacyl-tRNA deacylase
MRVLLQRVRSAQVSVAGAAVGAIDQGLVALVAVGLGDKEEACRAMARKICALRIFADEAGLMNRSLSEVNGQCLAVSQFTLYADCRKGRRPFFGGAAKPEDAQRLFELFVQEVQAAGSVCRTGVFGADMQVALVNDGPVTIWLDSDELDRPRRGDHPGEQ